MPLVLPDFGTNIKNGHEERIRDHEQTEKWNREMHRGGKARAEMQVGRMMSIGQYLLISKKLPLSVPTIFRAKAGVVFRFTYRTEELRPCRG